MNKVLIGAMVTAGIAGTVGLAAAISAGGGHSFSNVTELRIAAEKAGLQCPDWKRTSDTTAACSSDSVLIIVGSDAERDKTVKGIENPLADLDDRRKSLGLDPTGYTNKYRLLVGKNWIINSPDAPDLAAELGGTVQTNY